MDATDELGILVIDAIPVSVCRACEHSCQTMREMIRRDRNRRVLITFYGNCR